MFWRSGPFLFEARHLQQEGHVGKSTVGHYDLEPLSDQCIPRRCSHGGPCHLREESWSHWRVRQPVSRSLSPSQTRSLPPLCLRGRRCCIRPQMCERCPGIPFTRSSVKSSYNLPDFTEAGAYVIAHTSRVFDDEPGIFGGVLKDVGHCRDDLRQDAIEASALVAAQVEDHSLGVDICEARDMWLIEGVDTLVQLLLLLSSRGLSGRPHGRRRK